MESESGGSPLSNGLSGAGRTIRAKALFVAQSIRLKELEGGRPLAGSPAVMLGAGEERAVIFRYGVLVMFGVSGDREAVYAGKVHPRAEERFSDAETEEVTLSLEPDEEEGVADGTVRLRSFDALRLQTVAEVLARSVVLAHYEESVARVFDRVEPFASVLRTRGRMGWKGRDLMRQIGSSLIVQHKMVGRVEVEEKPELLWEHPELERLYERLADEFEIRERNRALLRKLDLVSRTAETLLTLQNDRRTLRVEWYIVILIFVEIIILLYEMFLLP